MWKRHWTLKYIADRVALMTWERTNPDLPWLTRQAIHIIAADLKGHPTRGIEFGSGRSTIWLARRLDNLISVEHDPTWARQVRLDIVTHKLESKIKYCLFEDGMTESAASRYVQIAAQLENETMDFALVDGVCRKWCANILVSKIKRDGMLVLDNCNRYIATPPHSTSPASIRTIEEMEAEWREFAKQIQQWEQVWTTNGVTDTLIAIKKC